MLNLLAWSERLRDSARVVIRDLGDLTLRSHDSVWELRAALRAMRALGARVREQALVASAPDEAGPRAVDAAHADRVESVWPAAWGGLLMRGLIASRTEQGRCG